MAQPNQVKPEQVEQIIDRYLPSIRNAMRKAIGRSGFGTVTIDIKEFRPKVGSTNSDREPDPEG